MTTLWLLSALAITYLGVLFGVAFFGERYSVYPGRTRLRPIIYSLALGVYCTTWTFFGAVGTAATQGWAYLPIYLGPALVLIAGRGFLERLIRIARAHNITSISDLVSARFGKSPEVAAVIALMGLTAGLPYLALQYKAVAGSVTVITGTPDALGPWYRDSALYIAMLMAVFAALFGTRRLDATEHHEGVMLAIAFESIVKLLAFSAVALFAMTHLDGARLPLHLPLGNTRSLFNADFAISTLISAFAIFCLPRQFQVSVVECADSTDVGTARWLFPLYLGLFSVLVVPIVLSGTTHGLAGISHADAIVLTLPMAEGANWLTLIAFLGGLSAATAMVIVISIALSTMTANALVMPLLWRWGMFAGGSLARRVLWLRRAIIFAVAGLAFLYYRSAATPVSLASIGLIAFALVAQFAPALLSALYWRAATRSGVFWGLMAGYLVWAYTLLLPGFVAGGLIGQGFVDLGPFGLEWARPQALLGFEGLSPTGRGALWALCANVAVLVCVSRRRAATLQERIAAAAFLRLDRPRPGAGVGTATVGSLLSVAEAVVGMRAARHALLSYERESSQGPLDSARAADRGFAQRIERLIAAAVGPSLARVMLSTTLRGRGLDVNQVAELLDETSQQLEFNRQLLQSTMENVTQGISVVDSDMRLVAWNQRYLDIFQYPEGMVYVGRPIAEIIRHDAERGECGPGDPAHHVEKRLSRMRSGSSYVAQRERLNGRIYEIRGQAMPGGGYVRTYTDITEFKKTERELLEAKQGLEQRVEQRTLDLRQALEAQEAAKRQAEAANLSKTRFVAAVTHDLLQPLNAARLFSAALESRVAHDTELSSLVSRIGTAMRAAEDLLAGLLDIARLDSGALQPELSEFPIADLVSDLERQYAPLASSRALQLRTAPTGVWVRTDRVLLRRVLQNLIGNALRYTARGAVLVGCRRHGAEVELQVFDTGPGIAAERQEAIFGEFRRLEQRSPWGEQGVGLGLAICDRIARLLGHTLLLHSRVGQGSMFAIRVTRVAMQTGRPAELGVGVMTEPGDLRGMRVLCVDNDPAILEGMKALLSRWGVDVECALDPHEAVQLSASQHFDAVLADYHLQGQMNGLDVLQQCGLAASPGQHMRCTLPVLITADHDPWLMNETRRRGHALLLKPLKPAALRALLASHKSLSGATAVCRVAASLPATSTA